MPLVNWWVEMPPPQFHHEQDTGDCPQAKIQAKEKGQKTGLPRGEAIFNKPDEKQRLGKKVV